MKDTKDPELMVCPFCGSHKVYTRRDVGFDIYTTDDEDVIEETQHVDICSDCYSERFRFERISMKDGKLPVGVGRWSEENLGWLNF